jgi:hypothetical protein
MARLNVTDRKLLVGEIIKQLTINPKEEQEKFFEEYLSSTKQTKKYNELVKQQEIINGLIKKQQEECSKLKFPKNVTYGYWSNKTIKDFEHIIKNIYVTKMPSEKEIETKILLSGSDDLAALIESIVNEYKQQ